MYNIAIQCPAVNRAVVVADIAHIGVTIEPNTYAMPSEIGMALGNILAAYTGILDGVPEYNGYLRIGIADGGKIAGLYEVTAWEARSAQSIVDLYNNMISRGKSITYYWSDGWGDVTKDTVTPYGRLSASTGNWL